MGRSVPVQLNGGMAKLLALPRCTTYAQVWGPALWDALCSGQAACCRMGTAFRMGCHPSKALRSAADGKETAPTHLETFLGAERAMWGVVLRQAQL